MRTHGSRLVELSVVCLQALSLERAAGGRPDRRDERTWASLVGEMNQWSDWHHGAHAIEFALEVGVAGQISGRPGAPFPWWVSAPPSHLSDALLDGLLSRVPSPQVSNHRLALPRSSRLGYLGDHLTLALADPRYVRGLPGTREALPLYAAALALASAGSLDFRMGFVGEEPRRCRERAARWLAEHLPRAHPAIPGADLVIDQLLEHRAGAHP